MLLFLAMMGTMNRFRQLPSYFAFLFLTTCGPCLDLGSRHEISHSKPFQEATPCIRLARGKFELTNQDLAGGKNYSVLM